MPGSWQASDVFAVLRRLVDDSAWTDAEKIMAAALIDAHGSQHVANTALFHEKLAVHGQIIGVPPSSPQERAALEAHRQAQQQTIAEETPDDPEPGTAAAGSRPGRAG